MGLAPNTNVSNEELSTTGYVLAKEIRDTLHRKVALLDAMKEKHGDGNPNRQGGNRLIFPVDVKEHALSGTGITTGYEEVVADVQETEVPIIYKWGEMLFPIVISEREEFENSGETAVINILANRIKNTMGKARRQFNEHAIAARADWRSDSGWRTLNGIDYTDGYLENRAIGSQTNSWGDSGSKATYATAPGTQNGYQDVAGSYNSNGLNAQYAVKTRMKTLSEDPNKCCWLFSESAYNNYKNTVQASERYVDRAGDAGMDAEMYGGNKLYIESYMPNAGTVTGVAGNNDEASVYVIDPEDIFCLWDKEKGYFKQTDFRYKDGQHEIRIAMLRVRGQLISQGFGGSAVIVGADTF